MDMRKYRKMRTAGDRRRLEWYGEKIFSQSDEDGIISEIFRRIGCKNKVFVEFGSEVGTENNTRNLLESGWSGLWIEGNPDYAKSIRWNFRDKISEKILMFSEAYVDVQNINSIIEENGISGEIDFLSIDIDGNDYHVFEAISVINPRVVCLEHNHCYTPCAEYVMPYNPDYRWSAGRSDFGASLTSMAKLAGRKGYTLVGCSLYGANGFYVRNDLVGDHFTGPFTPERLFNPLDYEKVVNFPVRGGKPQVGKRWMEAGSGWWAVVRRLVRG
ncbi:FkbM family methyltransferase [Azospirillum thermophilum]|uniref:Methyltransferase FkbM domain-containing protein n=1 Tax=Azospirillum thermophilum TaxID=2202148 RepID=A0A2S2D0I5_9PROT|nr:FkbM family methyltransferase [Azospirillum thermophilum]AWK90273.1 hypothetical protein DEW08_30145 [Azospirillum thermophilum]